MQKLLVLLPSNRGIFVSLWTCHELKLTSDHCELEGKIKISYACELDLDLFFKFIKISELICELQVSFDLLYNSDTTADTSFWSSLSFSHFFTWYDLFFICFFFTKVISSTLRENQMTPCERVWNACQKMMSEVTINGLRPLEPSEKCDFTIDFVLFSHSKIWVLLEY